MPFLKELFGSRKRELASAQLETRLDSPLVIEGHGVAVAPLLPCSVAHLEDSTLVLAHTPRNELRNALLKPGAQPRSEAPSRREWLGDATDGFWRLQSHVGGTAIALGSCLDTGADVFSAIEAGAVSPWRLHAPDFVIDWPMNFTLRTTLGRAPYPFELAYQGSDDMYLYLQGPFCGTEHIPPPQSLVGDGQTLVASGTLPGVQGLASWIELEYVMDAEKWRQRYYYVVYDSDCVFLLKAQVRSSLREPMWNACERIVSSFVPRH